MQLVLARGLFVACALSGFGAALFALTVPIAWQVNARGRASIERQVRKVRSLSLAAALAFGYAWLLLETHALAGTADLAQRPSRQFCSIRGSARCSPCRPLRLRARSSRHGAGEASWPPHSAALP